MSNITETIEKVLLKYICHIPAILSPYIIYISDDKPLSIYIFLLLYFVSKVDCFLGLTFSSLLIYFFPLISSIFLFQSCLVYFLSRFPELLLSLYDNSEWPTEISKVTREIDFCDTPQYLYSKGLVLIFTSKGLYVGTSIHSDCSICLTEGLRCVKIECGHSLCIQCSSSWFSLRNTCPLCRKLL